MMKLIYGLQPREWLQFAVDKNYGLRFKIANFIMKDTLRFNLAVSANVYLHNAKQYYRYEDVCMKDIDRAAEAINELFEM